ncbi:MAG: TolC family protein [Ignavibacteriaceae bacterium]
MHLIDNKIFILFIIFNLSLAVNAQAVINPDSALQTILSNLKGTSLTLEQAQDYAVKNSASLKQSEALYLAAKGSLRREKGYFDPEFFFNINYESQKIPQASFFAGADVLSTQQTDAATGLRLNLPIGTKLELSLNSTRLKTNSNFAFLNPEYDAFGSITLRQPLLSGFTASGRKNLEQAELNFESFKAQYDQAILSTNVVVEQAYWDLYTAARNYAVQTLIVERAEAFLKEAQLHFKAGLAGPNQVANAKTFWAEQKLLLIDRDEQLDSQSDQLAVLIGRRPEEGNLRFLAADSPPSDFPIEPVNNLVEYALDNNLNIQSARKSIDIADALVSAASWQALPQVDLIGSVSSNGLGGNAQDVSFPGFDPIHTSTSGSFGNVLSQVFQHKFPGWSIGVELSLPIGLRSGSGEKDRLEAGTLNAKQNYIELSRTLEKHIRTSYRELEHGNERLKASREGVDAAQEQVRIGMIEFKNGKLTAFELVRLAEDFAVAQQRYSDALVKTVKAAADLKQLTSGYYPSGIKQ